MVHLVLVAADNIGDNMSIFDDIRKQKETQTKTTANLDKTDVCPICNEPMVPSYSKGIPVLTCVKHNVCVPEIK